MSFWQTSDDVPSQIIQACTVLCEQDNCCLSARIGKQTCMGHSEYYTKSGQKIIVDNNDMSISVCCKTCWREWEVNKHDSHIDVKQVKGPPHDR